MKPNFVSEIRIAEQANVCSKIRLCRSLTRIFSLCGGGVWNYHYRQICTVSSVESLFFSMFSWPDGQIIKYKREACGFDKNSEIVEKRLIIFFYLLGRLALRPSPRLCCRQHPSRHTCLEGYSGKTKVGQAAGVHLTSTSGLRCWRSEQQRAMFSYLKMTSKCCGTVKIFNVHVGNNNKYPI